MVVYNENTHHWCLYFKGWIEEFATKSEAEKRKAILERGW